MPLDTRHFPDLELDILALFDDLDAALDGWLIHSENYQALNTLRGKFEEQVKAIYIDPPYNTKGSEITYVNDYKHSSWLTLVENRIRLGMNILQSDGLMCVAIDDSEYSRLHNLLQEIVKDEDLLLGTAATRSNPAGRSTVKGMSVAHDYAVFLGRSRNSSIGRLDRTEKQVSRYKEQDEESSFEWVNFRKHGGEASNRQARPRMFYPVYADSQGKVRIPRMTWNSVTQEWQILEDPLTDETVVLPIGDKGQEKRWKRGHEAVSKNPTDYSCKPDQTGNPGIYMKSRMKNEGLLPLTWWDKSEYSAPDHGTNLLSRLFKEPPPFMFPKSVFLVEDCLRVTELEDEDICLDFFAGSGTTAHAVINLNRADEGRRKYILVEMGEHFNTVILPRVKKVVFSDKWKDGRALPGQGISHFVKYYDLEQYEDTLRRAHYDDFADKKQQPLLRVDDPYGPYAFLRDLRLMKDTVELDPAADRVTVKLDDLYANIDLAETLSNATGKGIRRITRERVEFQDGTSASLTEPDWELLRPLLWW